MYQILPCINTQATLLGVQQCSLAQDQVLGGLCFMPDNTTGGFWTSQLTALYLTLSSRLQNGDHTFAKCFRALRLQSAI